MNVSPLRYACLTRALAAFAAALSGEHLAQAEGLVDTDTASINEETTDPGATPRGVVLAQMKALSEWNTKPDAAGRVFQLASPSNRAVTGPLSRFRLMVQSGAYSALISNTGWSVGSATEADGVAVVLVTLIDQQGELRAFRFYLSRLSIAGEDLWRTDAVFALPLRPTAPLSPDTQEDPAAI